MKLKEMAKAKGIKGYTKMTREDLLEALKDDINDLNYFEKNKVYFLVN